MQIAIFENFDNKAEIFPLFVFGLDAHTSFHRRSNNEISVKHQIEIIEY